MRSAPSGVAFALALACAALLAPAFTGCASSTTAAGDRTASAQGDLVCTSEAPTGSRIVETKCYSRRELAERRTNDQTAADRLMIKSNTVVKRPP